MNECIEGVLHSAQEMEATNFKWYFDPTLVILSKLDFILIIDNVPHILFQVVDLFANRLLFISFAIKITPKTAYLHLQNKYFENLETWSLWNCTFIHV